MKDILEKYSLAQLKKIVRRSNIVGYTKFDKDGLIKKMMEPAHKGNFKYLKKLKHDSVDDRKNNMKLVDGDLKVRREANKKKKAEDLKSKVPALTERKTAKKAVKTTQFGPNKPPRGVMKKKAIPTITITESKSKGKTQKDYNVKTDKLKKVDKKLKLPKKEKKLTTAEIKESRTQLGFVNNLEKRIKENKVNSMYYNKSSINRLVGYLKKKSKYLTDKYTDKQLNDFLKIAEPLQTEINTDRFSLDVEAKDISDRVKKTKNVKPKKKEEPKKKVEIKKRVVKKKEDSSISNFKKSQEGKEDIDKINDFYKNVRIGKSSLYNKVSDIKSIIKILKSNNQKVKDNFSDTRREILLESAEEILEGLSSSKDKPKQEEPKIEPKIEGKKKVFKKADFEEKKKEPVKKKVEKPKSKPIVYKTPMMKKEEKRIAKVKQDKAVKATQKAIDAFDKPKKKEDKPKKKKEKSSESTNVKKELHAKYLKKFNNLKDKNITAYQSQFEPKKEVNREEIQEKIDKITKVIISLEEDIKKTDSTRLKDLLPYFINMKKTYNLDLKN